MTAASAQPTLPGFDATSGIADESHLLPPLTGLAAKDPATPHHHRAKVLARVRNGGLAFAGISRSSERKPRRDHSFSIAETTAA